VVPHPDSDVTPLSDSTQSLVIAIDGPASSGKSSTARLLAERLGLKYLDTGMMYRVVGWQFLADNHFSAALPISAEIIAETVVPLAKQLQLTFVPPLDPINRSVILNGQEITDDIRRPLVSEVASAIAPFAALRAVLVNWQRAIIAEHPRIVCEGRDATTQIAPEADLKILLAANAEIRQQRRAEEQLTENPSQTEQLALRDQADNRVNPLFTPSPGVIKLDNSQLNLEQTVDAIFSMLPEACSTFSHD
jgi:cytidylate kinase